LLERGSSLAGTSVVREVTHPGGKLERFLSDGSRLILFKNQTSKRIFPDGLCVVSFVNGDRKHTESSSNDKGGGRVLYYYAAADTLHTTYPDGTQLYEFAATNQVEKHFPDGRKVIYFADGTVKSVDAQGGEEAVFPDGTVQIQPPPPSTTQQQQR
jgi:centromere protein J